MNTLTVGKKGNVLVWCYYANTIKYTNNESTNATKLQQ